MTIICKGPGHDPKVLHVDYLDPRESTGMCDDCQERMLAATEDHMRCDTQAVIARAQTMGDAMFPKFWKYSWK